MISKVNRIQELGFKGKTLVAKLPPVPKRDSNLKFFLGILEIIKKSFGPDAFKLIQQAIKNNPIDKSFGEAAHDDKNEDRPFVTWKKLKGKKYWYQGETDSNFKVPDGKGILIFPDENITISHFQRGMKWGACTCILRDGNITKSFFHQVSSICRISLTPTTIIHSNG